MSLAAAKYITKYTHKGPDRATIEIQQQDEVSEYRDSRYIAASEAAWRLFEIPIHHQQPAVMSLQVHLPGHHMVVFKPNESIESVRACAEQEKTMLTAFFEINRTDPVARQYTYQEIPLHFVWNSNKKQWKQRQRGMTLGRMYFVSPTAGERFYLRTLLTTVKGPTSWEDLRTFDGIQHDTFHATCLARGLLENDDEWRECLQEASLTHLGEGLRHLFTLILTHCQPSQPHVLWEEFKGNLCDDLGLRLQRLTGTCDPVPLEHIYDYGLFLIDQDLRQHGTPLSSFPSMPIIQQNWEDDQHNPYILQEHAYDSENEVQLAEHALPMLNTEQRSAFDQIYASVSDQQPCTFFLHGPGGTGKTFVYNALCHRLRGNGWIVLCAASSGIAALLLPGGHTAHSTFNIPVETLSEDSICQIDKHSKQADMLRQTRLIIWDEAVAQHRFLLSFSYHHPCPSHFTSIAGMLSKLLTVCFAMFAQQMQHLMAYLLCSEETSNKLYLLSLMEHVKTLSMQLFSHRTYGMMFTCFIFMRICVCMQTHNLLHLLNGSFTLVMANQHEKDSPPLFTSLLRCVARPKQILYETFMGPYIIKTPHRHPIFSPNVPSLQHETLTFICLIQLSLPSYRETNALTPVLIHI